MDQKPWRSYNKESMKSAMLNHEKIFREQVYELHRLYRVQKLLMNTMESASRSNGSGESNQLIDESEIELTLGPSIHHQKRSSSGQRLAHSNSTVSSQIRNNAEERLGQDRLEKHPPWLFQALSLKLT